MKSQTVSTPICDFLRDYASSGTSRFHMPGHKGRGFSPYAYDITEISGADSLYEAHGIILESERNASGLFGSAATFYSAEGSSQCIRAMLAIAAVYCRGPEGKVQKDRPVILAARNVHRSFMTACALLDLDVEWLFPENSSGNLYSCPVSAKQVRNAISSMKVKPAAVYITSPDYLGSMQDIASISQAAHEAGVPLLVDNAHGAYLHFTEKPMHPLDLGADMCCDSAHKTLPALTGCAYLHIGENAPSGYVSCARNALALFGSTSPSYLLLASLDRANTILAGDFRKRLDECISTVRCCRQALHDMGWNVCTADRTEPLKITVRTSCSGLSGNELADILRENDIECEFSDPDFVVLMASPDNDPGDFTGLLNAMKSIAQNERFINAPNVSGSNTMSPLPQPQKAVNIRKAMLSPSVSIPASASAGRICADAALSCPPAIPIVIPGEIIPDTAIKMMEYYGISHIRVCS